MAGWTVVPPTAPDARWSHRNYVVREKRLTFGRQYHVLDPTGALVGFVRQKMFRLYEDVRVFSDETETHEILRLVARKILDFNAAFDVVDSATGQSLALLRRKGWESLVRDAWHVQSPDGRPLAILREDSLGLALLRRAVGVIPRKFHLTWDGNDQSPAIATIEQRFQLWGDTYDLALLDPRLDARVAVGLTVLLDGVEKAREYA